MGNLYNEIDKRKSDAVERVILMTTKEYEDAVYLANQLVSCADYEWAGGYCPDIETWETDECPIKVYKYGVVVCITRAD